MLHLNVLEDVVLASLVVALLDAIKILVPPVSASLLSSSGPSCSGMFMSAAARRAMGMAGTASKRTNGIGNGVDRQCTSSDS